MNRDRDLLVSELVERIERDCDIGWECCPTVDIAEAVVTRLVELGIVPADLLADPRV